jgi:hypothetical protein
VSIWRFVIAIELLACCSIWAKRAAARASPHRSSLHRGMPDSYDLTFVSRIAFDAASE